MAKLNKTPKKTVTTAELGGSGTTVYRGVVSNVEYNSTLSTEYGGGGLTIFDRMRKSDPIVRASLQIVKLGLLQAEWMIESGEEQTEEETDEIKDFVEDALFERMDRPFQETLKDVLTYLDFGFYVGEKVFKIEDNKIWWKKFGFRDQKSIQKFSIKEDKLGVTQFLEGDLVEGKRRIAEIPIEKTLIFTNDKEGDNWRGVSILRSAFKPFFFKENFEKIDAIGFEREAVGVPVFTMPANPNADDVTKAEELGKNLRANEKAYIILPEGWLFEIYKAQAGGRNADESIRRFNREIFANVLAMFLDLGSGSSGSRALSEDQSNAFYKSLQAIGDYICSIINEYAIKQIVDLNFNEVVKYPKLKVTGIEKINMDVISGALQRLAVSGLIIPDTDLENHIRSSFRLPKKSKDAVTIEDKEIQKQEFAKEQLDAKTNNPLMDKEVIKKGEKKTEDDKKKKHKAIGANEKKNSKKFYYQDAWRDLTFAEEKVNFESLRRQMNRMEEQIVDDLPKVLAPEISSIMNDVRIAIQTGDAKRVEDIFIRFKEELRVYVLEKMRNSFEIGKLSAANELDLGAPRTSNEMINLLSTHANNIAEKITNDLLSEAKMSTLAHIQQATPVDDALPAIETLLFDKLTRSLNPTASVITVGGINQGRDSVFDEFPEMIYALQRSELLDTRICNYCVSMDARVVNMGDDITKHGQFHFLCRGIWVEILVEEAEKPEIGGIPEQLRERVGSLGEFQQIDKPMPLKNSLAEEFVKNAK